MTQINWNALQSFDIGGAFNQGMQAGAQRRRESETDNALRALIANPNDPNVVNDLARFNAPAAYKIQGQQQEAQQAAQLAATRRGAAAGDPQALIDLAGVSVDEYFKFDKQTREQVEKGIEVIGQAALLADNPQKWDQTVQQLGPEFAQYMGRFDLREGVVSKAKLAKEFIDINQPKYQVIPEGGTLVNTRDPAALAQVAGQNAAPQAAVPNGPDADDIAMLKQNPNAAAQFDEVFGPGAAQRALGGGGGNSTGNFPGQ